MIRRKKYFNNTSMGRFLLLVVFLIKVNLTGYAQQYVLEDKSTVVLKGSSTVNNFTCSCQEEWPVLKPSLVKGDNRVDFSNTNLVIDIKNLDCGNRMMNKDLQSTLNADKYPSITVSLLVANGTGVGLIQGAWQTIKAQLKLKLNGNENAYWTTIDAKRIDDRNLQFKGILDLKMTDFKIIPPRPFLGMIVVHDEMEVNLDLYIRQVN
ncbi:MAG: YceI family protein [Saprospiraceae bacterium]|nr:YceI family protein [Saprospiraceae bacterium]MCB9319346.1 YceI family protein [Lewinellaceae bacterium]